MKYIKRAIEDVVIQLDKSFKGILITGARQTGKTSMIKNLFPDAKTIARAVSNLRKALDTNVTEYKQLDLSSR